MPEAQLIQLWLALPRRPGFPGNTGRRRPVRHLWKVLVLVVCQHCPDPGPSPVPLPGEDIEWPSDIEVILWRCSSLDARSFLQGMRSPAGVQPSGPDGEG